MLGGREPGCLVGWFKVEGEDAPSFGGVNRLCELRDQQMRNHRGKPRAGTEHDPICIQQDLDRLGQAGGSCGMSRTEHTSPPWWQLAPGPGSRKARPASPDRGRSHPPRFPAAPRPWAAPGPWPLAAWPPFQPCDWIAEALPDAGDQEVANGVIIQGPRAPEPVLQHVGPGAPGLVIAAQRR